MITKTYHPLCWGTLQLLVQAVEAASQHSERFVFLHCSLTMIIDVFAQRTEGFETGTLPHLPLRAVRSSGSIHLSHTLAEVSMAASTSVSIAYCVYHRVFPPPEVNPFDFGTD